MTQIENNHQSINIQEYFDKINQQLKKIYSIAVKARKKGLDPTLDVEIPIAKDIADRVEGLIGPKNVGEKIRILEKQGLSREKVAFEIAEEICLGNFIEASKEELADQALRTSLALITESITAAPLEGIAKVKIKKNSDNSSYLAVYYAGPIRSAGGTAAGMSVLLADHIRNKLGLAKYKPTQREIERYVEEIELYNRIKHLQLPTLKEEQRFVAENLPIEITGEKTEDEEVAGNRDLPRVETNNVRGGSCLVFNDGLVGRAKKIYKRVTENKLEGWDWLTEIEEIHKKMGISRDEEVGDRYDEDNAENVKSDAGYIKDVIAGRPVFAHPSEKGGFRIRYGRARTTGLAAMGVHPALMGVTDDFLACGTHVRTERPGKGAIVMPVDSIHPPIVKLKDGSVRKVRTYKESKQIREEIDSVLFLGDMLYGFGEFNQNNYNLIPAGYCVEWWAQELETVLMKLGSSLSNELLKAGEKRIKDFIADPFHNVPSDDEALKLSQLLKISLHPEYTYHWHDIHLKDFIKLREYVKDNLSLNNNVAEFTNDPSVKTILEQLCIPHQVNNSNIVLRSHSESFLYSIGYKNGKLCPLPSPSNGKVLDVINSICDVKIRAKSPVYTGVRMGRPEKAKERRMRPPIHLLYPIGEYGGRFRDLFQAAMKNTINVELVRRKCPVCGNYTRQTLCTNCNTPTVISYTCRWCKKEIDSVTCPKCERDTIGYSRVSCHIEDEVKKAKQIVGGPFPKRVKAVKKLMNKTRVPEQIAKGILRAKHDLFVYRDGTVRFDSTDAILTHFKPREIGVKVEHLRKYGYSTDKEGNPLVSTDQIVELKIQDVILNDEGGKYLVKVAQYIDELLEKVYELPKYYNAKKKEDLIGRLIVGLAPHTSAGITGRIVGFTKAKVNFAHPYWQAAKRRNCLSGAEEVVIWDTEKQQIIHRNIGDIVENLISKGAIQEVVDDFGTVTVENLYPHWNVVSINEETKLSILQPIKHWIKGESNNWVKIRTELGRTLTVTPNHNMLVWNESSEIITKTKARLLEVGDSIPIVKQPPIPAIEPPSKVNILRELAENLPDTAEFQQFKHQVRLRNAKEWLKDKLRKYISQECEIKLVSTNRIPTTIKQKLFEQLPIKPTKHPLDFNWYESIPLSHLEVLQKKGIFEWDDIPNNAVLGMTRDDHVVKPYINFNHDLIRLIGYLIAEGYIRDERTCYQINFSVPNPDLRKYVKQLIQNVFESEPYYKKDNHQLVHTGRIHAYLFAYAFGIGKDDYTKRIPAFIFSLRDSYKYEFISAIIDGDGSIISRSCRTTIYTINSKLAQDYGLILSLLGIYPRFQKVEGGRYGKKVLERYQELGIEPKTNNPLYHVNVPGIENERLYSNIKLVHKKKKEDIDMILKRGFPVPRKSSKIRKEASIEKIKQIDKIEEKTHSYCLEVSSNSHSIPYHNILTRDCLVTAQCDGDEDSVLLALDAFLNFSKFYLPAIRGGLMDAPLVLVANINPQEVDDEAHNVDVGSNYPISFYEATLTGAHPKTVLALVDLVRNRLNDESAYEGFKCTHETSKIFDGPESTLYKRLNKMGAKVNAQLEVAQLIRAVDAKDVANKVIVNHFIPDLIGNLRAFGTQKIRCTKCNKIYRRMPLKGVCLNCGMDNLNLTVYEKSVTKYFNIANELVKKYNLSEYLVNRLALINHNVETLLGSNVEAEKKEEKGVKESVKLSDFFLQAEKKKNNS